MPLIRSVCIAAGGLLILTSVGCGASPAGTSEEGLPDRGPDLVLFLNSGTHGISLTEAASLPAAIPLAGAPHFEEDPTPALVDWTRSRPLSLSGNWDVRVVPEDTTLVTYGRLGAFQGAFRRKRKGATRIEFAVVEAATGEVVFGPLRATFTVEP